MYVYKEIYWVRCYNELINVTAIYSRVKNNNYLMDIFKSKISL